MLFYDSTVCTSLAQGLSIVWLRHNQRIHLEDLQILTPMHNVAEHSSTNLWVVIFFFKNLFKLIN